MSPAVLVDLVAGEHAAFSHGHGRLLRLVPVFTRGGRTEDAQIADFTLLDRAILVVNDLGTKALYKAPTAPRQRRARPVEHEHVRHFRGADTVEDVNAGIIAPALHQRRWQHFT